MFQFEVTIKPVNRIVLTPVRPIDVESHILQQGVRDRRFQVERLSDDTVLVSSASKSHLACIKRVLDQRIFNCTPIEDTDFARRRQRIAM